MVRVEDIGTLEALNKFREEHKDILNGICWGCPGALRNAVNIVNSKRTITMVLRLKKYERIPVENRFKKSVYPHIYLMGKAVKGLPSTVTVNNETDQIVELIKENYPEVYKANYKLKEAPKELVKEAKKPTNK